MWDHDCSYGILQCRGCLKRLGLLFQSCHLFFTILMYLTDDDREGYVYTRCRKPDHIIYDSCCLVKQQAKANPWFMNIGMCVDPWHLENKHKTTHDYCRINCDPKDYPELDWHDDGSGSLIHYCQSRSMCGVVLRVTVDPAVVMCRLVLVFEVPRVNAHADIHKPRVALGLLLHDGRAVIYDVIWLTGTWYRHNLLYHHLSDTLG